MILYATKQTIDRYKLETTDTMPGLAGEMARQVAEQEENDCFLHWGMKLFYFDGRKCLMLLNRASKFGLVLPDFKKKDIAYIGDVIAHYLLQLYANDDEAIRCLMRMFKETRCCVVKPIKDRSFIAAVSHFYTDYLFSGYLLQEYISDGILHSMRMNHNYNFNYLVPIVAEGEKKYLMPAERFRELLVARYADADGIK